MSLFRRKHKRRIVAAAADTHGGNLLGLCSPDVKLTKFTPQGQRYYFRPELTETQKWLWERWEEDIAKVEELADGDPIVLLHVGDETDGDKYQDQQMFTQKGAQLLIAAANVEPWYQLDNLQKVRYISGTGAHNFKEDSGTLNVIDKLQARHPGVETELVQHGLFEIDTVAFDVAHHGPSPGTRKYTEGRQLTYYTESLVQDALEDWEEPPKVVLRAHYHTLCWQAITKKTKHGVYKTEAVILPAYCGLTEHGRQATKSISKIDCGLVAFEIVDDRLVGVHPFWRSVDLRTKEVL